MSVVKQDRIVNIQKKIEFDNVVSTSNLSVVHFWAPWATQCKQAIQHVYVDPGVYVGLLKPREQFRF